MTTSLTRPEVISFVWISHIYCDCDQHEHLLLIHSGRGLIALGLGLDLVASALYTSGLINIPDSNLSDMTPQSHGQTDDLP